MHDMDVWESCSWRYGMMFKNVVVGDRGWCMRGGGQKVLLSDRMPVTLPSIITIILHYRGDHQTEDAEMGVIPPFTESLQLRSLKNSNKKMK